MRHTIAERIKSLRKARQIPQEIMAEHLGMSRQRYSRIENGQSDVPYQMIVNMASLFGTSPQEITKVARKQPGLTVRFRDQQMASEIYPHVDTIEHLLKTLYAHEKLYKETADDDLDTER